MSSKIEKNAKPEIKFSDFTKLDIRAGEVINCAVVEGSDKLLNMKVDLGEIGEKQVIAGISKWYHCSELVGKQLLFVVNMETREIMGLESEAMLVALGADHEERPVLVVPDEPVDNGAILS